MTKSRTTQSPSFLRAARSSTAIAAALAGMGLAGVANAQTAPANIPIAKDDNPVEAVIVTATRDIAGVPRDLTGSSTTLLTPQDLEDRQTQVVSDVLRDVPGVEVNRTGTVGGLTQVRIRGAESNHTLTLIDGIKASDPYEGEFDYATLIADDVAKVEVVRGEQSALYGSDAIGGVVNYITASGKEAPGFRARIEGGSFGTEQGSARLAGITHGLDFAISGNILHTDGIAVAPQGTRDVGANIGAAAVKLGYEVNDHFRLKAIARYSYTNGDTDDQDFSTTGNAIDSDGFFNSRAIFWLAAAEYEGLDGRWSNALTIQGADTERKAYEFGGEQQFGDTGNRIRGGYVTSLKFDTGRISQTLTGAVDLEREQFRTIDPFGFADTSQHTVSTEGVVGQYDLVFDKRLAIGGSIREDYNDLFRNADTFHGQGSYRFDEGTRIHAAGGSGIKNPGPFELFGYSPFSNFRGNPNLKPEKSVGWEAGVEQVFLNGKALIDVTYFDSTLTDEIATNFVSSPNTTFNEPTNSTRRGVEVSAQAKLPEGFRVNVAYTHLDAKQAGVEEIRRAPDIASANLSWRAPSDRYGANLTVRYNGDQTDTNFATFSTVTLKEFTLVNLGADYRLTKTLQLYGRIENRLDEDYREVVGFREPGRAAYVGLKAGF